jgi:hypothetical protein
VNIGQEQILKELRDMALSHTIIVLPQETTTRFEPILLYHVDYTSPLHVTIQKNRTEGCFLCGHEDTLKYNTFRDKILAEARIAL